MARSELLTDNRNKSFLNMLKKSHQLDIVSAYVTHSKNNLWQEIMRLAEKNEIKVRLVAGLDGAVTSPEVLGTDLPGVSVKGYLKKGEGIFHPKLYIFHTTFGRKEVFLGSANFTQKGFEKNEEIILHITDRKVVCQCQEYFNEIWSSRNAVKFSPDRLGKYEELHQKSKQGRGQDKAISKEIGRIKEEIDKSTEDSFTLAPSDGSFLEYCSLIYQSIGGIDKRLKSGISR